MCLARAEIADQRDDIVRLQASPAHCARDAIVSSTLLEMNVATEGSAELRIRIVRSETDRCG